MNFIKQLLENLKNAVYSSFKDNISGADLTDMQLISKYKKGIRFLFCVIAIFIKYAWVVPLKDKKGITVVNAFQSILNSLKRKPNKIFLIKAVNSIKVLLKNG